MLQYSFNNLFLLLLGQKKEQITLMEKIPKWILIPLKIFWTRFFEKNKIESPEIIVLFLEPELTTEQFSDKNYHPESLIHIKEVIEKKNSLFIPYVIQTDDGSINRAITNVVDQQKGVNVIYSGQGGSLLQTLKNKKTDIKIVKIKEIQDYVNKKNSIFSNGITDLIIIQLNDNKQESHNNLIESLMDDIRSITTNYVGILTAEHSVTIDDIQLEWEDEGSAKRFIFQSSNITDNSTTTNSTTTGFLDFFPGYMIEAILIVFLLIAIAGLGISSLNSIQTPDKLPPTGFSLKFKEFN